MKEKMIVLWRKFWHRNVAVFLVVLLLLTGTFYSGYSFGQKGKSIGIGPKDVVNTEVGKPSDIDFSVFWEAWNKMKNESVAKPDTKTMIYGAISGMISSINDPYTTFFTPEDNKRFRDDIQGSFDGIGVELIAKNGMPTVVAPLSESPAAKAGMKAGDIIYEVDGTKTATIGFNETISKIRGLKGTKVNLKIVRAGVDQPLSIDVVRDTITVKSVTWENKDTGGKRIMYVKVRQFGDDTDKLFADFVESAVAAKPDGIVIDLRNNPGGYFEAAVNLSSYFVDGGTVVQQQDKNGQKQEFGTTKKAVLKDIKTAVLVNGGSASASEIFSGALKDRKAGVLIGEQTFGKGSVQELVNLSDESAVKITVAKWLTPNGTGINGVGITPDIVIKNSDTGTPDLQLNRALEYIVTGK